MHSDADLKLNRNGFVETALSYALSYIYATKPNVIESVNITILADNNYYSTAGASLKSDQRFHDFSVPLSHANKTGLGSSAALVTALTGALLQHYLPESEFDITNQVSLRILHNLAQISHSAAQGKVGSGFDVASAVYGTCRYRRFTPDIIVNCGEPGIKDFETVLLELVNEEKQKWDTELYTDDLTLPKGLRLVMCDVKGGSVTSNMVKKVLTWRATQGSAADELWSRLNIENENFTNELQRLHTCGDKDYTILQQCFQNIRALLREMSLASGVPIEPPEQTRLLDACSELEGVIGGTVPGAGGSDAIALIIEDRQEVVDRLDVLLKRIQSDNIDFAHGPSVSILGVHQSTQGVRLESPQVFESWLL